MLTDSSTVASQVDAAFYFIIGISTFLLLAITGLMIYFVIRYNYKRNPRPTDIEGNLWLEVVWTVIPVALVMAMFYYGFAGYKTMRTVPKDAMTVKVTAMMWRWSFEYENGIQSDVLRVPLGKPVKVLLRSNDVIHSFYVPAFRTKKDVVPGKENMAWFEAISLGEFDILCAEYCGIDHSKMLSKVIVMPEAEFARWYTREDPSVVASAAPAPTADRPTEPEKPDPLVVEGGTLAGRKGCLACHSRDGTEGTGPTFRGLFGRQLTVLVGGAERDVVVDEAYVRKATATPEAEIVKGYQPVMPPAKLTDNEMSAILAYLKSLK
jgi:cytochrome c oxidase subunit 2